MRGRTAKTSPGFRSPRNSWRTCWKRPVPAGHSHWICTRHRFRAISTCPWITYMVRLCWWNIKVIHGHVEIALNLTVVSPDAGGVERARFFAKKLDAPLEIGRAHV